MIRAPLMCALGKQSYGEWRNQGKQQFLQNTTRFEGGDERVAKNETFSGRWRESFSGWQKVRSPVNLLQPTWGSWFGTMSLSKLPRGENIKIWKTLNQPEEIDGGNLKKNSCLEKPWNPDTFIWVWIKILNFQISGPEIMIYIIVFNRWADQCTFEHDNVRTMLDGTRVGQNLYQSFRCWCCRCCCCCCCGQWSTSDWIRIWMDGPGLDKTLNSLSVLRKLTKMDLMLPSIQLFRLRSLDFQWQAQLFCIPFIHFNDMRRPGMMRWGTSAAPTSILLCKWFYKWKRVNNDHWSSLITIHKREHKSQESLCKIIQKRKI